MNWSSVGEFWQMGGYGLYVNYNGTLANRIVLRDNQGHDNSSHGMVVGGGTGTPHESKTPVGSPHAPVAWASVY